MSPSSRENAAVSRPARLKIPKESHPIHKPSSSSSASSSSSTTTTSVAHHHRHPVIIYTHSPKIIHTEPRDFMALVQKLTGLSPCNGHPTDPMPPPSPHPSASLDDILGVAGDSHVATPSISSNSFSSESLSPPQPQPPPPLPLPSQVVFEPPPPLPLLIPGNCGLPDVPVFSESPYIMYPDSLPELCPAMGNGWINHAFDYGDEQDHL